jgi:hypothetical protein
MTVGRMCKAGNSTSRRRPPNRLASPRKASRRSRSRPRGRRRSRVQKSREPRERAATRQSKRVFPGDFGRRVRPVGVPGVPEPKRPKSTTDCAARHGAHWRKKGAVHLLTLDEGWGQLSWLHCGTIPSKMPLLRPPGDDGGMYDTFTPGPQWLLGSPWAIGLIRGSAVLPFWCGKRRGWL